MGAMMRTISVVNLAYNMRRSVRLHGWSVPALRPALH
jgi:hypothetical protein